MSCMTSSGRCTRCCDVLHVPRGVWANLVRGDRRYKTAASMRKYWIPVSRRRAKKINPYIFSRGDKDYLKTAEFFKCRALVAGEGCSIRGTDEHPYACTNYKGGVEYSPTCQTDINIIARG